MAARRQWGDLPPRTRQLIIAAAAFEAPLKVAALIDLKRLASQIRGPKWLWAVVVVLVNSVGGVPISYFLFGRRRQP